MLELRGRFSNSMRYCMARGPRCFRCRMFMLSGPVELFVLAL